MTITIDGPAAAGKSTLARTLARRFGLLYLNSGAIYRAVALWRSENPDSKGFPAVDFDPDGFILVNGECREGKIRTPKISMAASDISKKKEVRRFANDTLKAMAETCRHFVAEGRDMGTSVFPDADIKIYLDADIEIRAMRRWREHPEISYNDVLADLRKRDEQDSIRELSPLTKSDDALVIDNSYIDVEKTISLITKHINNVQFPYSRN